MKALLAVGAGLLFGVGMTSMFAVWHTERSTDPTSPRLSRATTRVRESGLTLALSALAGAVAGFATGWPVAVPIVACGAVGLPRLFGQTSGSSVHPQDRIHCHVD